MLAPMLVGHPLSDRHSLADAAASAQGAVARNFGAKAAVDTALRDVFAQAQGRSLAALLAGPAGALPVVLTTDVTLAAGSAESLAQAAPSRTAEGFTALKLKVGTDAATDVARVAAVRTAVGDHVTLRLDANQGLGP